MAIETKEQLVRYLREAAEIEHQLMIQYLYAAFSFKKRPDERCDAAQFEHVRRWASQVYMVARQEMEHLALVNGVLTAVGADPWFARENIPRQSPYFLGANLAAERGEAEGVVPCDIPFVFERFNLATIGRFVCMESPGYRTLVESGDPIPWWCFGTPQKPCQEAAYPAARTHLAAGADGSDAESIRPGTIQKLYDEIEDGLRRLSASQDLFTGDPSRQVFVPVEYQINIFPVTDLGSAITALKLITEEGEGIDAPPGFQSHFRRFFDVREDYAALLAADPDFSPSLPVVTNPSPETIADPFARELAALFDDAYTTLLFVLTSLYKNFVPTTDQSYPYFSAALQETAFGPVMTMLLRPIAEVLAHTRAGDGDDTAGPSFHLAAEAERLLVRYDAAKLGDVDFFLDRFGKIVAALGELSGRDVAASCRGEDDVPFVRRQLAFVYESATALTNNLRRIYQIGQFAPFVVNP